MGLLRSFCLKVFAAPKVRKAWRAKRAAFLPFEFWLLAVGCWLFRAQRGPVQGQGKRI
jgi:hypothetical protein